VKIGSWGAIVGDLGQVIGTSPLNLSPNTQAKTSLGDGSQPKSCGDGPSPTISVSRSREQCLVNSLSVRSNLGPLLTVKVVQN